MERSYWQQNSTILFIYLFIYFNWRLITLQYCIGFAIHQHESAAGVHEFPILNPLPPASPYHLSGSSQCTSPEHPVSGIEPGLAIHFIYDIIHVSMPFSQIIPPSPSPTMEYYSAIKKNTFESVLMRWMKLEPIIQSEVSQKEKHRYSILMHIYGI